MHIYSPVIFVKIINIDIFVSSHQVVLMIKNIVYSFASTMFANIINSFARHFLLFSHPVKKLQIHYLHLINLNKLMQSCLNQMFTEFAGERGCGQVRAGSGSSFPRSPVLTGSPKKN